MPGSNFATAWDAIARASPDAPALIGTDRRLTWAQLAERAHDLAWHLRHTASLQPGDRVAIALENRPEYLEAFYATLTIRCVPVNVSPRAAADELHAVLDDSDAKVVIHAAESVKPLRTAAKRIPKPWRPQLVEIGAADEQARAAAPPDGPPPLTPDGSDLVFLYPGSLSTGGAAPGRASAVMWRADDLYRGSRASTQGSSFLWRR